MKIRARLTLWFTILVGSLTLVSNTIILIATKEYTYNQKIKEAYDKVEEVENLIIALNKESNENKKQFNLEQIDLLSKTIKGQATKIYEGAYLQVLNVKGQIISRSPNLGEKKLPIMKNGTLGQLTLELPTRAGISSTKILYLSSDIFINNIKIGYLQVGLPLTRHESVFSQMLIFELLNIFICIAFSILLGRFLSKRALIPVTNITDEVNKMVGRSLLKNIDTEKLAKDEIGILASTFNDLIERISSVFNSQQRFISDASHELRSPLTAIKGYAQLILKRGKENPELTKNGIEIIIKETERLERLVNDMLLLIRSGEKSFLNDHIDIISLVRQLVLELKPIYPNLTVEENHTKAFLIGNPDSLRQVFINLINNALRAVSDKGNVHVFFEIKNPLIYIHVEDNGIGI
ncbi:HAMP domain-containing histidine kinase, partial [bacterium]